MNGSGKSSSRRAAIRASRPDTLAQLWSFRRADGTLTSFWIAVVFAVLAVSILSIRREVVAFRPGQYLPHDVVARTEFAYRDKDLFAEAQNRARIDQPRVYKEEADLWTSVQAKLQDLPKRVAGLDENDLPPELQDLVTGAALTRLREAAATEAKRISYEDSVAVFIESIRKFDLVIIPDDRRPAEIDRAVVIPRRGVIRGELTYSPRMRDELAGPIQRSAAVAFPAVLQPALVQLTLRWITPTHTFDDTATAQAQRQAAETVSPSAGERWFAQNQVLVAGRGEVRDKDWQLMRAEADAFARSADVGGWYSFAGLCGLVALLTAMLAAYIAQHQPRIIRNHARGLAIAVLLLATLLVAQLAGISSQPLYVFALAPTMLVAMIMSIVYDRRFGIGVATIHTLLVTFAVNQGIGFLVILVAGVVTACTLLDEIRSRSKLIEVGGAAAMAMILAAAAVGLLQRDPPTFVLRNCLHAGAAGLGVGFIVLGILPFIEKLFRITTAMTLLEIADVSQPLLRRIATEAPGTWNHSLQVAAMAEQAAETIHANSLLCRVGAYYHDCGKINKPEYFVENQQDGVNRHFNLSPSVSLLIIIGHVKDGVELAREYNLPTSIFPFIQQHHGTTLVEFFYDRAIKQAAPDSDVSENQYRYPGPKPKSREIATLMLADCCESAARAMREPTPTRLEALVDDMARRRLEDGQFNECDLTMKELELIKRSMVKSLLGIYHGRIAYPSAQAHGSAAPSGPTMTSSGDAAARIA